MSFLANMLTSLFGGATTAPVSEAAAQRRAEWQSALEKGGLPSFVKARLGAAAAGRAPWLATLSAAELGLVRSKGIRPLGMVSGTCWYHSGQSWMRGHVSGWHHALTRLKQEAVALGANAVVDVGMRKIELALGDSMDFTLVGTAVKIDALPAGKDPVVATVSALEFVRLIEADIVPVGIAIGAHDASLRGDRLTNAQTRGGASGRSVLRTYPASRVGSFWEGVRRRALNELKNDALRQGNGVLAHTHFGQILHQEGTDEDKDPPRFIGRHIVIGTVVDTMPAPDGVPHTVRAVVDMRDGLSPLSNMPIQGHNTYPVREQEGAI
jgi:hypothetical protein